MVLPNETLRIKLQTLPDKPGVYQYLNKEGVIIYVGKAKHLKKRVNSYFKKDPENGKTAILVRQIVDLNYIVVETEMDALLLENNLIKKYQPKYNIQLKDDKTYPWICVKKEAFPRVFSTRRVIRDGSNYYGPYPSGKVMHTLLALIKELYPLRTCSLDLSSEKIAAKRYKVCLEYHIGNCLGPCVGHQLEEDYGQYINEIDHLLKGNIGQVIQGLKKRMLAFADQHAYEAAHEVKMKINTLENYQAKSTIVSPTIGAVDVCTLIDDPEKAYVNYLCIQNGSIIHAYTTEVKKKLNETRDEILGYVITEFRERFNSQTKELLTDLPLALSLPGLEISIPQRGDKKQLVELSQRNTKFYKLDKDRQEKITDPERHTNRILNTIKSDFRLTELPVHMECFDNSNLQGTNAVSACVVFKNGKPSKQDYRHFNVQTVDGPDDFATMEEVVYRRYHRLIEEGKTLPQLVIIDGGKGQLSAALKALERLDLRGKMAIVGIAKRLEEIFFPGDSLPIYIDKRSESLKVVQFMRNEAHRFGITHHRNKRSKHAFESSLAEIPGIGPKTYEVLMKSFKTVSAIRKASEEELTKAVGLSKARLIATHLQSTAQNTSNSGQV
jgi:excinuclease ABC subunit C